MNQGKKINTVLAVAIIALLMNALTLTGVFNSKKIAFVRSTELVYKYTGMQDAHREFDERSKLWQANIDTLQSGYRQAFSSYSTQASFLKPEEREQREKELMQQQEQLLAYANSLNTKAKAEDEKITAGVLNQINSFVEDYGRKHGYDMILGTTTGGNLLYGEEAIDITDELLEELNKNYLGEQGK